MVCFIAVLCFDFADSLDSHRLELNLDLPFVVVRLAANAEELVDDSLLYLRLELRTPQQLLWQAGTNLAKGTHVDFLFWWTPHEVLLKPRVIERCQCRQQRLDELNVGLFVDDIQRSALLIDQPLDLMVENGSRRHRAEVADPTVKGKRHMDLAGMMSDWLHLLFGDTNHPFFRTEPARELRHEELATLKRLIQLNGCHLSER